MESQVLPQRVADAYDDYLALGNQVRDAPGLRVVRNPQAPDVHDANYASRIRADTPEAIDAVLAQADRELAGLGYRRFLCDPRTPPPFEAALVLEGYRVESELHLLLEGELLADPIELGLRLVDRERDWRQIRRLMGMDSAEINALLGREPYSEDLLDRLSERHRAKSPAVRTWLARIDGADAAHVSSWPGSNGLGKVEDLFTHPDFRHRGVATALIAHAVADARARGAGPVTIGARVEDTPRHMYRALGFRPVWVQRGYFKTLER